MMLDLFRNEIAFENVQGYDDLKDIVRRVLNAEDNYNLLFVLDCGSIYSLKVGSPKYLLPLSL